MAIWLILTGDSKTIRGRYDGTKAQAEKYCRDHYMPKSYKIVKDNTELGKKLRRK